MPSIPPGLSSGLVPRQVRAGTPYPAAANNSPLNTSPGTTYNPFVVLDSDDDGNLVDDVNSTTDVDIVSQGTDDGHDPNNIDMAVDGVINGINASTVHGLAASILAGDELDAGRNGNPPDYTEPSFRERVDAWLQAYSVMPPVERRTWFTYMRRYFNTELEHEVDSRTAHLHARNNTLSNDVVVLRRLLSRRPDASRRFDFDHRSSWTKNKFRKTDFENMSAAQVRNLSAQLLKVANNDINHPIIKRNAVYSACIRRFQSLD
ncbi:hypothetical protein OC842_007053 [Tilletia horrida]|uniref:Uncharacterized protein n=1 Tax=Tilletia horrida TaxID=155126 RepID=A0AAN6JHC5_9BASI|nr:hypothetical protein OC842_007053 [Tilletia horrida]KAK0548635.1 hypothetical protein OC844_006998 [Tilletia horrida]